MNTIKIGTRGSRLALYQAELVQTSLQKAFPEYRFEIKIIKTKGDKILDVALSKIGDKGLFTKELEIELLNGNIDLAVHSLKDLPTVFPEGLKLGAVLERGDKRDALVSLKGKKLNDLDKSDVLATSSLRRKAQLLKINPDFKIVDIRGNVNTRLQKMQDGLADATVMAAAGLKRMNFEDKITEILEPETFIPAVSQGAIATEIRSGNEKIEKLMQKINHPNTALAVSAERNFLRILEGGCQVPIGCNTQIQNGKIRIRGFVSGVDAKPFLCDEISGPAAQADKLAKTLAGKLIKKGAQKILNNIRLNP